MKKILLILTICIMHNSTLIPQDNLMWSKTFGGSNADGGNYIIGTSDRCYIITGYTYSFGAGKSDIYVIKIDSDGNELWSKTYGGSGWEYGYSVYETSDTGLIITGYTTSFGSGSKDVYLIKTNSSGDTLWTKTFGGPGLDVGRSVCETGDGSLIICGYTESFGAGEDDIYLIKTDANGDSIWTKTIGGAGPESGDQIKETNDNNYIIAGSTGSFTNNRDPYLIKTDTDGNPLWARTYGVPGGDGGYDRCNSFCETSNGSYILIGEANHPFPNPLNVYWIKTDTEGLQVTERTFDSNYYDYGNSIQEISGNNILICGTRKTRTLDNNCILMILDAEGTELWSEVYGGDGSDWGSAVCKTTDGYVVVGHTNSEGFGSFDVWLFKVNDYSGTSIQDKQDITRTPQNHELYANYPNPFNPTTTIRFDLAYQREVSIKIYDIQGKLIRFLINSQTMSNGSHSINWDGKDENQNQVGTGEYFYKLEMDGYSKTKKMLLLK